VSDKRGDYNVIYLIIFAIIGAIQFFLLSRISLCITEKRKHVLLYLAIKSIVYAIAVYLVMTVFRQEIVKCGIGLGVGMVIAMIVYFVIDLIRKGDE